MIDLGDSSDDDADVAAFLKRNAASAPAPPAAKQEVVELLDSGDAAEAEGAAPAAEPSPKKSPAKSPAKSRAKSPAKPRSKSPAKPKKAPVKLVRPPAPVFERVDGDHTTLEGLTFVFTGVCGSISREECEDYVKMHGGKVTGSVSGNTKCERARGEGEARTGGGGR